MHTSDQHTLYAQIKYKIGGLKLAVADAIKTNSKLFSDNKFFDDIDIDMPKGGHPDSKVSIYLPPRREAFSMGRPSDYSGHP
jgi:hypothetical protein